MGERLVIPAKLVEALRRKVFARGIATVKRGPLCRLQPLIETLQFDSHLLTSGDEFRVDHLHLKDGVSKAHIVVVAEPAIARAATIAMECLEIFIDD
jgi:hypothetical protein